MFTLYLNLYSFLMNRIIPALLVAAFVFALMPLAQYEAESFGLCFLIVALAALLVFWKREVFAISISPLLLAGGLFWVLALLSVLFSEIPYVSFIYFCFFSVLPLAFIVTLLTPDKTQFFKVAGGGLALVFVALALSSLAQFFFMPEMLFKGRVQWPLANPNSLAGLLSLGFFCALGGLYAARMRRHSNAMLVLAVLLLAALLTTGSRGAFAALIPAGIFFLISVRGFLRVHRRCTGALGIAAVVIFFAINFFPRDGAVPFSSIIAGTMDGSISPLSTRPALWQSAFHIMLDHLWTGTGIGTFFLYYPEYRGDDLRSAGLMAHNDPLQFGAEMGVFAVVLFYAFIIAATLKTWRAVSRLAADDVRRLYILAPFYALVALIIGTHITFHFYVLPILLMMGILLGFWFVQVESVAGASIKNMRALKPVIFLLLILCAAGFSAVQGGYILAAQAKKNLAVGDIESFAADVNRAHLLSRHTNDQAFILAATIPMGILETQQKSLSPPETGKLFRQGYDLLENARALNPRLAAGYYYQAHLMLLAGIEQEGENTPERLLSKALRIDPAHISSRLMLAGIHEKKGEGGKALLLLREGLKWPYAQQDPEAYYQVTARLALERGDREIYTQAMEKMRQKISRK